MTIEMTFYILFTMAFSRGLLTLAGVPEIVPKSIVDMCILCLFIAAIHFRARANEKFPAFGLIPLLCFLAVSGVSYYMTDEPILAFFLFCRHILVFYLFFLALINLRIPKNVIYRVNRYVILLFLIQIPANFVKFLVVGQNEGQGIGTMSQRAGSLTTIFVLFALSFCFAEFLFKRRKLYLMLSIGFFLFGLIGEKRAIVFYIPPLVAVIFYYYIKDIRGRVFVLSKSNIKLMVMFVLISGISLFCAVKLIPSLNRKQIIGGKFEPSYLVQVVKETTTWRVAGFKEGQIYAPGSGKKLDQPAPITLGRYATTKRSLELLREAGAAKMMFGLGAGHLIQTSLLDRGSIGEITMQKYNIAYGVTGFVWTILQVGLLGAFLLVFFYVIMFRKIFKLYRCSEDKNYKAIALGFIGSSFVFAMDYFTYSTTMMTLSVLTPVYFYIAFILFKGYIPKDETCEQIAAVSQLCADRR
ncbi:MAG: hypothetical protein H8E17_14330 [Deltaproteobacteria bacterium]|nr:hypothetical protein [Deltaproteobacteria bacterium]